jgi:hypothetical protein
MNHTSWTMVSAFILIGGWIVAHASFPHRASATAVATAIASVDWPPGPTSADAAVTFDGVLVCLPQREGGQQALTLACAIGLHTADGKPYALENINPYLMAGKAAIGQHVKVSGWLRPNRDKSYDAIGTINVTSVNTRDPSEPAVNQ